MTVPRAIVAEDEAPQRRALCKLLEELWPELEIVAKCTDGLGALEALTAERPDIAFVDIRMPGLSGLEVARAASEQAHVVFTTAYDEYAVTAFEAGAIDYLLKPIRRDRLARTVERLKERIGVQPPRLERLLEALQARIGGGDKGGIRWITGSVGSVTKIFGIDEVLFFQAQDKYVRVATAEDEVHIRTPLRELVTTLDPQVFWQVHRSAIVRAGAIQRIETNEDGKLQLRVKGRADVLPVSQAFQFRFRPM
ncbi:MAG: response regulator transcription factor [Xanthomonadaceae bacterium]|nr:response regulator transcription factor [Xanthomonadaceae bacterium]